ncbi:glycine cleavage system aminomethyltransferase GcvT [Akkermansiaceae bacterium]|nr:glycine cleavage system aminomethyltransferase GcvT [Akkermansiaceae bacterium]MDC0265064.1 glycine cleavage system aminomethyltransferase GcvT [bacterium]MDC0275150.1 glycine cleavage system aminomethyltransferase GcvT [Akkermansiaceae bacterium]
MSDVLKLSPLDQQHRDLGGRMVAFAGWEMPVMYSSIIDEHKAVREKVGVFDISHMGQVFVSGKKSGEWLNRILANDIAKLETREAHYTFLLNDQGGVIDDLIVYRLDETDFLLLINAAKISEDADWLAQHLEEGITMDNLSNEWAGLAVQGPDAAQVYTRITEGRTLPSRNHVDDLTQMGHRVIVCRTGYTGEDGFELFCPSSQATYWWNLLMEEEVTACGLGSRDSLRLEMCYPLNGSDLSSSRTPLQAGLGMFVALDKERFIGGDALRKQKEEGISERLMAIQLDERGAPPRPGYTVVDMNGSPLGNLTSGGLSPSLGAGIGLAYLPTDRVKINTPVQIEVRGKHLPAKVVKKPFYRK